jgi:cell division protein FtsB
LSQAANTFWDDLVDRTGVGVRVRPAASPAVKVRPAVKRRVRAQRFVDGIILTIILAAAAMCVSIYSHARVELESANVKHSVAAERLQDLKISVETLERDVQRLRTDSRVIEHFARQKFGFVRSGEVVIKLPQDQKAAAPGTVDARPIRVATLTLPTRDGYTDNSN